MTTAFRVEQIDHIHVHVADQVEAAEWYGKILGLEVLEEYGGPSDDGPLMVSSDGGKTSLALFKSAAREGDAKHRSTVAFRVGGEGFVEFLGRLEAHEVTGANGRRLKASDVVDHDTSYSVYFTDPYGNPYELTTYDYDHVSALLGKADGGRG